jgi:hypothetical protein
MTENFEAFKTEAGPLEGKRDELKGKLLGN